METRSFEQLEQQFRAAAAQANVPQPVVTELVDINRGVVHGAQALATWDRWLNAPPNDPIGDLLPAQIRELFRQAVTAWTKSRQAVESLGDLMLDPANVRQNAERIAKADWHALRTEFLRQSTQEVRPGVGELLDTPIALAKRGLVGELFAETVRTNSATASDQLAILESLERVGPARLAALHGLGGPARVSRGYSPYWKPAAYAGGVMTTYTMAAVAFKSVAVVSGGFVGAAVVFGAYAAYELYRDW